MEVEQAANTLQQYISSHSLTPTNPSTLVSLAGLASVADDRMLNTRRNELQIHLQLTTHETSFDQGNY